MKQFSTWVFIGVFVFTTSVLRAGHSDFQENWEKDQKKNTYSWKLTDESQTHQALGMVVWGFVFVIGIAIISFAIPDETSSKTTTGQAQTNGNLF